MNDATPWAPRRLPLPELPNLAEPLSSEEAKLLIELLASTFPIEFQEVVTSSRRRLP